jgi:tRNA G37 N-methylase Trm5
MLDLDSVPYSMPLISSGIAQFAFVNSLSLCSAGRVKLIGIELNEQMCELQKRTADKMGIDDILIINDDMRNRPVEVGAADIIVLNNVFQFFLTPQDQRLCWQFLRQHLKQNAIVVTNPSIAETTEYLQLDFALDEWLEQVNKIYLFEAVFYN